MSDLKTSVQQQFGQVAANYRTSAVHAKGIDLVRMVELAELQGDEQVLDAGCGAGHTAMAFAPHVAQVTAIDLTESMLEQVQQLAAERGVANVATYPGDVEELPFPDATFDQVVSRYSAHHWPHPQAALHEFRRVLRPGGRLLLSDIVGFGDPTSDTFLNAIELLRDTSHVRDHRPAEWLSMLAEAGFDAEVSLRWDLWLDFESWVERMATPAPNVAILRQLFDGAPQEVHRALQIQETYNFALKGALFHARRR